MNTIIKTSITALLVGLGTVSASAQNKPYRLPSVDLKQRVIWGSECIVDDNLGLQFGGQDQQEGGAPPTKIRRDGQWRRIEAGYTPSPAWREKVSDIKGFVGEWRRKYLAGQSAAEEPTRIAVIRRHLASLELLEPPTAPELWRRFNEELEPLPKVEDSLPAHLAFLTRRANQYEQAIEMLTSVPAGRALSPIVYDKQTGLFFLFGGDHLDYLTNDAWVFDPKREQWKLRHVESAPPPRANHQLTANGDGTITLSGGYTYANNTDYMGGQYVDIGDGEWTYDIAKNEWSGGKGVSPLTRHYRTGKFHPDYFLQGPRPDRAAHQKVLDELPANEWISLKPPHLPEMNRDWGTAVLDPDRDLILRWSGGHCAHSGSDVLHYHIATNRWELPFPVEFPLGQCYVNTEFPEGVNFNGRPWVTGHTYQNYGYEPILKKMIFAGRQKDCFIWDPDIADWHGRLSKPSGMSYESCFYTLTLTPTPQGLICWTQEGRIFQLDAVGKWQERKLSGDKLPGAVVDNSTIVYDPKRKRLLAVVKPYGDESKFSGEVWSVDCADWKVSRLQPEGHAAAAAIPYLCQLRYDAEHDLLLVGATLPPDDSGLRRTAAYDCAGNRWVSLKITGDDPNGPKGRNVSLGMMYDAKRELFFAVDTKSNVFALKLEPSRGDLQPLH